ncbi:hypothetical protein R1sor_018313 [Riccia sorocarpa]|uniref:Virilizer N-terminal domain-containing protein n=1 Tax=Riccia sorocarpa TaxID=122646 RepID=A0ABD3IAC8_9MARC
MVHPTPSVLLVETFRHHRPGEHVDEVRFHEPVVISAVEIVDINTPSQCKSVSLSGATSPQTFGVEFFVRSGGDTRFKRLCHPFLYSSLSPPFQDVQLAVTDHLVIRGTYDALTMVVYGNSSIDIGQLSKNHDLGSALEDALTAEVSCRTEDLPEALQPQKQKLWSFTSLQHLLLVRDDQGIKSLVRQLLRLAEQVGSLSDDFSTINRLVKVLVSAVTSLQVSAARSSYANVVAHERKEASKLPQGLLDARCDLENLRNELQDLQQNTLHENGTHEAEAGDKRDHAVDTETSDAILLFVLRWIEHGIHSSEVLVPALFPVKWLIGGLAAAQLLCLDSAECYRFVASGGMTLLTEVIQRVSAKFSITTLLALGVVEHTSRFAFGCEALLGWWSPKALDLPQGSSTGYQILVNILLQPHMQHVAHLALQILHRLRAYQLTAVIQSTVDQILEEPAIPDSNSSREDDSLHLSRALVASKHLMELLNSKGAVEIGGLSSRFSRWLMLDTDNSDGVLSSCVAYGVSPESNTKSASQDIDPFLLAVLQERRLLPLLAALMSSPRFRSSQDYSADLCVELVGVFEGLILTLLNCRSGLLFLTNDMDTSIALLDSFQRTQEVLEKDLPPLRHAVAVTDAGFLCKPQDVGATLQVSYSVMRSMDRLLTPSDGSHDPLWALWELCRISRHAIGKQAVLTMAWFPEVIGALVGALERGNSHLVFGETWKRPAVHLVAKIFQVLVSDPAASSVATWLPYASLMHRAMSAYTRQVESTSERGETSKDGALSALIEWLDSALVYQKKGTLGLLKYASAVAAGGVGNPQASAGLLAGDSMDIDSNVGDQGGNLDVPNVIIPFQARWGASDASATALTDTALVQLTVAFRILSLVSSYPGIAAVLYGEGAMVVVQTTLNHCAIALTTVPNDYDVMTDEEVEDDAEDLSNHKRERLVLRLLLPTLTFLLTLCRSLEHAGVEDYKNTKLVDVLLALHHCISARSATYASVPPHTWTGITQELIAVHHVLASVLVCWPAFGWAPALFPRLLGANKANSSPSPVLLPMEPGKTCSVLSLLIDMMPHESPQTCNTKTALVEMYRSLNVGSTLGLASAAAIRWHTHSPHVEKLLRALSPHMDQIAEIVLHHSSTICGVLQGMLKLFVIRLACKSVDHAAVIVRPILNRIREQTSSIASGAGKQRLQVNRLIHMVAGLALHPATKQVLLREGAVEVLVKFTEEQAQFLSARKATSPPEGEVTTLGSCRWIMRAFAALCDPEVSVRPSDSLGRRLLCDCPSFGDCCSIASCLLILMRVLPLGKELEYVLEVFGKFASHKLGRAAVANTAIALREQQQSLDERLDDSRQTTQTSNDASFPATSLMTEEYSSSVLLDLWGRMLAATLRDQQPGSVIANILRLSALSALILSAAGKSACGMGALKLLFGVGFGVGNVDDEKLKPVVDVIAILEQYLTDQTLNKPAEKGLSVLSSVSASFVKEACTAHMTMFRILKRPESVDALTSKVEGISKTFSGPRIFGRVATETKALRYFSALPAVVSLKENLDMKEDIPLQDESSSKESELLSGDSRGRLVWECPMVSQDKPALGVSSSKRKPISLVEAGKKRYRSDSSAALNPAMEGGGTSGVGRVVSASTNSVPTLNRRDMFRQRKPNTSRPPSMHVDDYVARERNTDGVTSAPIQPRSSSGSGRPPSIHVDEFMARQQQERQQLSAAGNTGSELQRSGRNLSLTSIDSGRKERSEVAGNVPDDIGQGRRTQTANSPALKEDSVKHEVSVVESAAVGPSAGVDLPEVTSSAADVKPERTPSSSASVSAATNLSIQGDRTPQVADMMLLQSKVTLQASVSQSAGLGSSSRPVEGAQAAVTSGEEQARIITRNSTTSIEMQALSSKIQGIMPLLASLRGSDVHSSSKRTSDEVSQAPQRAPEFLVSSSVQIDTTQSSFFPPQSSSGGPATFEIHVSSSSEYGRPGQPPHIHVASVESQPLVVPVQSGREPRMPYLDFQGRPVNLASLVRDMGHLPSTSGRTETPSGSQNYPPPPFMFQNENSPQVNSGSRGLGSVDPRANESAVATDPRLGFRSDNAPQATDPRPRRPDMLREKRVTEPPPMVVQTLPPPPPLPPPSWAPAEGSHHNDSTMLPPPPPPSWAPAEGSHRNDSTMLPPPPNMLSPRPNIPNYGPPQVNSNAPRAPQEVAGVAGALQQAPNASWSGQYPGSRFFEEGAMGYNTSQRPPQPQLPPPPPPPPVGHSPSMHGPIQGMGSLPSPLPHQHALTASNIPMDSRAGSQVPAGDRRFPVPLQGYPLMSPPSVPQQATYIAPPLPAGRPAASQIPVNVPTHQQFMQLQQQNIVQQQLQQQQQQQVQARHLPLHQHTAPQHVQHQMHGPQLQMQIAPQGLVLPLPPPPPPLPPPLPQQQLRHQQQQQESSAFLQQMLASPDAIQALLRDQNKLRELLEQHPKLISLLQEKMSQAPSQ